jgi:hypothetical protein
MQATESIAGLFWLIPLVMMAVCFVGCFLTARGRGFRSCCGHKTDEQEDRDERDRCE